MASLQSELEVCLSHVCQALEQEENEQRFGAAESYQRAKEQLQYVMDMLAQSGQPQIIDLCKSFLGTYTQRIQTLTSSSIIPTAPTAPEQPRTLLQVACTNDNSSASTGLEDEFAHAGSAIEAGAAGAGASPEQQGDAQWMEILQQCQRTVSGTMEDIAGLMEVKEELSEAIFMPIQYPELFKGIRRPPRTFLLHGPPGTGKTMLVEKTAAEAGLTLLALSPGTILSKWSGESEKSLRLVFDMAKALQPSLLFIDEIDSIGQSRKGDDDRMSRRLLTELLLQMTAAAQEEGVYIFAATNRLQDCDAALVRRFDRRIQVPLPDAEGRRCFLEALLEKPELADADISEDDIIQIVNSTEGYSGADLTVLCRDAAMGPVRELLAQRRRFQQQQTGSKHKRSRYAPAAAAAVSETKFTSVLLDPEIAAALANAEASGHINCRRSGRGDRSGCGRPKVQTPGGDGSAAVTGSMLMAKGPRPLMLKDFLAALEKVKPVAVDCNAG